MQSSCSTNAIDFAIGVVEVEVVVATDLDVYSVTNIEKTRRKNKTFFNMNTCKCELNSNKIGFKLN